MEENYPIEEFIFVLKNGRKLGPFEVEHILEGLEQGDFSYDDICLRDGATECERLRDVLDWDLPPLSPEPESELVRFPGSRQKPAHSPNPRLNPVPPSVDGDTLLYSGHPSILSFPVALASLVGGVTLACWMLPLDITFAFLGFGIGLCGLAYLSLAKFMRDYHITPKRIEMITGLVARSSKEVRIEDVRAINVACRGLSGILGIGTVEFFTSGDQPEVVFKKVWAAKAVKTLVRRIQDAP